MRISLFGLCLFCLYLSFTSSALAEKRPNVLFITVDDMNCDSVGSFGCQIQGITPHIDKLAKQGLRFEHGHVTIAICQPTRAVWMTGRYPHRSGALGFDPIRKNVPTLLELVKKSGYFTGILGKVNHVVPTRRSAWDVVVPANQLQTGRDPKKYYRHCVAFFKRAKSKGSPFFLMANSQDPHRPFAGSNQERARIARQKKKKRRVRFPGVSRTYKAKDIPVPGFLPDLRAIRREVAEYYTSVHRADEIVGEVLRALKESGMDKNTCVIFMSDHGMPLPFAKTNCWYHSTRTPWIVRWPGVVKPNSVDSKHFVSGIDFTPTILEAAGLPSLAGVDGRSIMPLLRGKGQTGRDYVFTHINRTAGKREFGMRSVQSKRFGYIFNAWSDGKTRFRNESQSGRTMRAMIRAAKTNPKIAARVKHFLYRSVEEFYDYSKDKDARRNLIGDPKLSKQISQLRNRLRQHMQATGDPLLAKYESLRQRRSPR